MVQLEDIKDLTGEKVNQMRETRKRLDLLVKHFGGFLDLRFSGTYYASLRKFKFLGVGDERVGLDTNFNTLTFYDSKISDDKISNFVKEYEEEFGSINLRIEKDYSGENN